MSTRQKKQLAFHTFDPFSKHPMLHPFARYFAADDIGGEEGGYEAGPDDGGGVAMDHDDPAPNSQTGGAPEAGGGSDDLMQVSRSAFEPFGGDYHEAIRKAKLGKEFEESGFYEFARQTGMTGKELMQLLQEDPQNDQQQPGQDGGLDKQSQLTAETIEQIMERKLQERDNLHAQRQQQQALQQAQQQEAEFVSSALEESGYTEGPFRAAAQSMFAATIQDVMAEKLPSYLGPQQVQKALSRPASRAELEEARKRFEKSMEEFENRAVSKYAKKNKNTPGASLGSGAGGRPAKKSPENMSWDERVEALTPHMRDEE